MTDESIKIIRAEFDALEDAIEEWDEDSPMDAIISALDGLDKAITKAENAAEARIAQAPPREPTPAMSAAGFVVSEAEHDPAGVWRAMYDAAIRNNPPVEGDGK